MAKTTLPPGFRFYPTDIELILYYLKRKVMGKPLHVEAISVVELYKFAPWDLPDKSCLQSKDLEWYFFCPRDRKYANGSRTNRATDIGYWKITGKDRSISYNSQIVGMKRTLVFHVGRAPKGDRTNWVMHEYRLEDNHSVHTGFSLGAYVLCKIFQTSGPGPKNGEQYGAPFIEEDWEDDTVDDSTNLFFPSSSPGPVDDGHHLLDSVLQSAIPGVTDMPSCSLEHLNLDKFLQELLENNNDTSGVQENGTNEMINSVILHESAVEGGTISDGNEIYNGLEVLSGQVGQVELNPVDCAYVSSDMDREYALQHTELGIDDGSYMELKDLQFPVESDFSEPAMINNVFGYNPNYEDWYNVSTTSMVAMADSGSNSSWKYIADDHGSVACQTTEEIGNGYSLQVPAGGKHGGSSSNLEPPIANDEGRQGRLQEVLQYLLGSLPARPAIAAEYQSTLKVKSWGSTSYYGRPIHVSAEVTFRCVCPKGCSVGGTGESCFTCCPRHRPLRKIAKDSHASGGGFLFVFLLGLISASLWICLLTMGLRLGKGAWKFFLS